MEKEKRKKRKINQRPNVPQKIAQTQFTKERKSERKKRKIYLESKNIAPPRVL